jgi:hypothetical protein
MLPATSTYLVAATLGNSYVVPVPSAGEGQEVTFLGFQTDAGSPAGVLFLYYAENVIPYDTIAIHIYGGNFVQNESHPVKIRQGVREVTLLCGNSSTNALLLWNVS